MCSNKKGVIMLDFNSGMGYGMMGGMGMMPMGGMMGMNGGASSSSSSEGSNYWHHFKEEYGCEDCFVPGPKIPECHIRTMPLPPEPPLISLGQKVARFFGF